MPLYHFDLGNSHISCIGFCAQIRANSKEESIKRLQSLLPEMEQIQNESSCSFEAMSDEEYIHVYFNGGNLRVRDIDFQED